MKLWMFLAIALGFTTLGPAHAEITSPEISRAIDECADDPHERIGGEHVGNCLRTRALGIEQDIATALHRHSKRYCNEETRDRFQDVQSRWEEYRTASCSLIGDAPGTAPAYVNAAACEWQLARQRLESLSTIDEHAYERCLTLSFELPASRFGPPPSTEVFHPSSSLVWRYSASDSRLEIMREGSKVIDLEASDCSYCTSGEPCSEGVFMFEYLTATTDDPHMRNYGLLHACRKPDGVSFVFVSDLGTKPAIAAQAEKLPTFDWMVDDNALTFASTNGWTLQWNTPPSIHKP